MIPFAHQQHVPLSQFCSFKIGGPARYFSCLRHEEELAHILPFCFSQNLPFYVLGKGSNCLFDDRGFNGLVLLNAIEGIEEKEGVVTVGSGFSFARLGKLTSRLGYSGLEFASGIPATVGGAIFMNAGANGQETKDVLHRVDYYDAEGKKNHFFNTPHACSYRTTPFQQMKLVITQGIFALKPKREAKERQQELLAYRIKTQPYKEASAGCVFRNPPSFSAGALIEKCGLKGARIGDAEVSLLHANFIVNRGRAKCADVLALIEKVRDEVFCQTGVHLEEEVRRVPYES